MLTMVGFTLSCFGILLFLWLAFGGPVPLKAKGYRFHTSFGEATQLAKEADVRISGVSVGKVKDIKPDKTTGRSQATIELDAKYAPLPKDTKAILRQKTLLGETYVELTPGHPEDGTIKENGTLAAAQVSPTVELDEIFRAFNPQERKDFQSWMQNMALATNGRSADISDIIGNLSPFAEDTNRILKILNSQSGAVRALSRNTGVVFSALSERQGQLAGLITNANKVFATTARRNQDLQQTFRALPTFQREASTTLVRVTKFANNANPLIDQLRPAAKQLSPTLRDLSALAPNLKALFRDLGPAIDASKAGLPATQKVLDQLHPVLAQTDPVLAQLNPIIQYFVDYKEELNAFFSNTVASTQATNVPAGTTTKLHYLRTTNPLNLENLAVYNQRLGSNRSNPYQKPGAFRNLADGLPVFSNVTCGRANIPNIVSTQTLTSLLGSGPTGVLDSLVKNVQNAIGKNAQTPAPPCNQQDKFNFGGELTQYPHVNAARDGNSPSGSRAVPRKK